ncbi:MAG: energy-coupling factor transporter transmembrane protein EcfT [Lachnospiraceae bacterium]|nr:energy-coupling factor transporter transmembrane protein EcfT [Lachnospiraceae bacterium]
MRDAFSQCHPIVNFIFYIGAIVMGMCFLHPAFLCCSLCLSFAYYATIKKERLRYLLGMSGLFAALSLVNPLFSPYGDTVLFVYLGDRPYTLEALSYGMVLAAMFVTVLTWFATYNQVMTSDKFLYCFGRLAPSVSLLLTMALRMVPLFQKRSEQIRGARKCIGKSIESGSTYEKAEHGMVIVSALTSWALEGGIVMADSMRSRGLGSGKRTSFSIYRMEARDKRLLCGMAVLLLAVFVCAVCGGMKASYIPQLEIAGENQIETWIGVVCYFLFLSIPTAMNLMEELTWHILRSRM